MISTIIIDGDIPEGDLLWRELLGEELTEEENLEIKKRLAETIERLKHTKEIKVDGVIYKNKR